MLRKFVCAVVIMGFSLGLALAEEFKGRITKVDGSKVWVSVVKDKKAGDAVEYSTTPTTKVSKKEGDAEAVKVEGGTKASVFSKISDKGLAATITVDDANKKVITSIVLTPKAKK